MIRYLLGVKSFCTTMIICATLPSWGDGISTPDFVRETLEHVSRIRISQNKVLRNFSERFPHINIEMADRYIGETHDLPKYLSRAELARFAGAISELHNQLYAVGDRRYLRILEVLGLADPSSVKPYVNRLSLAVRFAAQHGASKDQSPGLQLTIAETNELEGLHKALYFFETKYSVNQIKDLLALEVLNDTFDARTHRRRELRIHGDVRESIVKLFPFLQTNYPHVEFRPDVDPKIIAWLYGDFEASKCVQMLTHMNADAVETTF